MTEKPAATKPARRARAPKASSTDALSSRALAGGRVTIDQQDQLGFGSLLIPAPLSDPEGQWHLLELDARTLQRVSPSKLLELLADLSPEVSRALWDFLRLCNPGWEAVALIPGTEDPSKPGQAALDAFLGVLDERHGTVDVLIGRLHLGAWLCGAYFSELVLDQRGRMPLELATPDPRTARFRRVDDPQLGTRWQLGQQQRSGFVPLDVPTVRYIPVDPFPHSPYGRPLATPAVYVTLFLLGLLHDLRRVVAQQGYPRIDLSIDLEKLKMVSSLQMQSDPVKWQALVQGVISDVERVIAQLQPDDFYVHTSVVTVGRPVGAIDSSSLGAVDGLIQLLEKQSVRALKSMPMLMGIAEGTSEANANRQWEMALQSIKAIQHLAEALLGRLFTLGLQAQGVQATVRWRFAENRASEMLRDQQTRKLRNENNRFEYLMGWRSHEDAALDAVGHAPAEEEPLDVAAAAGGGGSAGGSAATANPEPGANRSVRDRSKKIIPKGADLPIPPAEPVTFTKADERAAAKLWDDTLGDPYRGLLEAEVVENGSAT